MRRNVPLRVQLTVASVVLQEYRVTFVRTNRSKQATPAVLSRTLLSIQDEVRGSDSVVSIHDLFVVIEVSADLPKDL